MDAIYIYLHGLYKLYGTSYRYSYCESKLP